jgi:hypothetical protein
MDLPLLTPMQNLVLAILVSGAKRNRHIRHELRHMGLSRLASNLCRLLQRLERLHYVGSQAVVVRCGRARFREYRYTITDLGLQAWRDNYRFYTALVPPDPWEDDLDLEHVDDAAGHAYDPRTRKQLLRRQVAPLKKRLKRLLKDGDRA